MVAGADALAARPAKKGPQLTVREKECNSEKICALFEPITPDLSSGLGYCRESVDGMHWMGTKR